MSKKDSKKTSTNDIFLKVMSRQKEEKKDEPEKEEEIGLSIDNAYFRGAQALSLINSMLDKMLATKGATKILSFVITALLVVTLSGGSMSNLFSTPTSGDVITEVPVEVTGLSKDNVISGVVDEVEVMVTGSSLDIYALKVAGDYSVYIDVTNLKEGEHAIEFKTNNFSEELTAVVIPSSIVVKIESKVTQTFPLSYRYINESGLEEGQSVALLDMAAETVEVRGSQEAIESIVSVEANIDLTSVTNEFSQDALIVAYDSEGNEVDVEFTNDSVAVSCRVDSYSKTVPLLARTQGTMAENMMIEDIVLSDNEVVLYGNEETLEDITAAYVYIDVSGIAEDTTKSNATIRAIEGVNKMSIESVDAIVTVDTTETVNFKDVEIAVLNQASDYTTSLSSETMTVTFTGAKSVINSLKESDFSVSVDLTGLEVGTHSVDVKLNIGQNYLTHELSKTKIEIEIKE